MDALEAAWSWPRFFVGLGIGTGIAWVIIYFFPYDVVLWRCWRCSLDQFLVRYLSGIFSNPDAVVRCKRHWPDAT